MEIMKPEIISREFIKPSSPTSESKRIYKISIIDKLSNGLDLAIVLFYQKQEGSNNSLNLAHTSSDLKKSLSETLTHYYPLAGRMIDGDTIECNGEGACFTEAQVEFNLEEFLKHHDDPDLKLFMPEEIQRHKWDFGSLLNIHITFFSCGGTAIGIRISHLLLDIAGFSAFINDWAIKTNKSKYSYEISVELTHFFPPANLLTMPEPDPEPPKGNLVRRRFVFDSIKVDVLRRKANQSGVANPSRVQLVAAIIYRCAVAASIATSGFLKPFVLFQVVNLRKSIIPSLWEKSFGNMLWIYNTPIAVKESDIEFPTLVGQLKAGLADFREKYGKNLTGQELVQCFLTQGVETKSNDHVNKYICSSWCKSSLYEADFGWGKPIWLTPSGNATKNVICLNDTREGNGIEAFVTLEEEDMAVFESDEELLQFCYLH